MNLVQTVGRHNHLLQDQDGEFGFDDLPQGVDFAGVRIVEFKS